MQRALLRFGDLSAVAVAAMLMLGVVSCGDDDDDKPSKKDAGADSGKNDDDTPGMRIPTGGRGGRGGAGGASGTGGAAGTTGSSSSAYTCVPRKADSGGPTATGAECCGGKGMCGAETDSNTGLPHETCKSELRCLPKPPSATTDEDAGMSVFKACRVRLPQAPDAAPTYEGRCMANCFVLGSPIGTRLSQEKCDDGESCAPCFNPLTSESTGLCDLSGDTPLESAPKALAECGDGGTGYCVPAYAAGNSAGQLSQLTCAVGELCAPKNKVADPNACFEHCDAGAAFGPGACAPTFLAGQLTSLLSMSTCKTGEVCIPCEALGIRTGVCD